ncbi:MAG: 30S ribosomal protein S12 methylthiotransferase RimO [Bacteroidales bacterium]|nr:30S ribosomal protein S12 methylthiotransferase RimO [Bacteroidales bacterium]
MNNKINIITLGCSKNLVDSEVLMGQLKANNVSVSHQSDEKANIIIINTCGFIEDAKQESIDTIFQFVEAKKSGIVEKVFVMGCLSERYKSTLKKEIPEVDGFFGVNELPEIIDTIGAEYKNDQIENRIITTPSHYAYLKISEGCDRKCSFCAIPLIRGKHISKPIEVIVSEAKNLAAKGVKELILIAQDLTYYGIDIYKKQKLAQLIIELEKIQGVEWIRLHYTYPASFPDDVLDVIAKSSKVCNYIDIPLQHISDTILKSMKRNISAKETKKLIEKIRLKIPNVVIRTTMMLGYPGETDENFNELSDFVQEYKFDRLGVFTYSAEEDTFADTLNDDVSQSLKQQRADEIMGIQEKISLELNNQKIGKIFKVLIDREEGDYFIGRTEFDSPEVDNEVLIKKDYSVIIPGNFYYVKIIKADFFDLFGKIEN